MTLVVVDSDGNGHAGEVAEGEEVSRRQAWWPPGEVGETGPVAGDATRDCHISFLKYFFPHPPH